MPSLRLFSPLFISLVSICWISQIKFYLIFFVPIIHQRKTLFQRHIFFSFIYAFSLLIPVSFHPSHRPTIDYFWSRYIFVIISQRNSDGVKHCLLLLINPERFLSNSVFMCNSSLYIWPSLKIRGKFDKYIIWTYPLFYLFHFEYLYLI